MKVPRDTTSTTPSPGAQAPIDRGAVPPVEGEPPRVDEPQRSVQGESVSQPPPGARGPHANPVAPESAGTPRSSGPPGQQSGPDLGAIPGPHPPAPATERRVAQLDPERWQATDRRRVPFRYPDWRT